MSLWRPPPWPIAPPAARLVDRFAGLARRAAIEAPPEGLARIVFRGDEPLASTTAFARAATTRIACFERWLSDAMRQAGSPEELPEPVRGLIGLGPGLTPSGDDFLIGAVALLDALGERDLHVLLIRALSAVPPTLTSALSRCFVRAAAAGHVGEKFHAAVSSVITGTIDEAIAAAHAIGHSSGWDMLAGIASALRIVARFPGSYRAALSPAHVSAPVT
jgi:hypothetical protein